MDFIRGQHRPIQLRVEMIERLDLGQPEEAAHPVEPRVDVPVTAFDRCAVISQGMVEVGERALDKRALVEHGRADRDPDFVGTREEPGREGSIFPICRMI